MRNFVNWFFNLFSRKEELNFFPVSEAFNGPTNHTIPAPPWDINYPD